ncbi:hypothetical protein HaLaN_19087, partial [Haematococcus lacustris]
ELAEHIRQVHSFAVPAALTELVTDALPIRASINLAVNVERDVKIGPFLGSGMAGNVYQATYQGQQVRRARFGGQQERATSEAKPAMGTKVGSHQQNATSSYYFSIVATHEHHTLHVHCYTSVLMLSCKSHLGCRTA